jgi:hypothetical protein
VNESSIRGCLPTVEELELTGVLDHRAAWTLAVDDPVQAVVGVGIATQLLNVAPRPDGGRARQRMARGAVFAARSGPV